jgi:hypothetical protein
VNLDVLEDYRRSRDVGPITWRVELQALRTFFTYCVRHKWLTANPASEMKLPRNVKPNEIVPYTPREEARDYGGLRPYRWSEIQTNRRNL